MEESLFWADQIARQIIERKRFKYVNQGMPKFGRFVVKTSASISGVLHIGRLSDTIRGESVFRALQDAGTKAELIWVAEDMDPLRKIPEGVPKSYAQFIGVPVTDIPDPEGCHKSYGQHHTGKYFEVLDSFVSAKMKKLSMREEYRKGSFNPYIKKILEKLDLVMEIQNRYRTSPLKQGWSPWTPICRQCGKIITPRITRFEGGSVYYSCKDYEFEKTVAKGCGYEGEARPAKDPGKLLWKAEWASQWALWKVVSEGAGKEYQVPMSAFWVNAEICERVLGFPAPVPIFYEHLMIEGRKMSASLGNVVYPHDWLSVATPELLRYFYNKRLMKTRSFSWKDLPNLFDEYDRAGDVYFGRAEVGNEREGRHIKRLFEISQIKKPADDEQAIPYDFASMIAQTMPDLEKSIKLLESAGHIKGKLSAGGRKRVMERLALAKNWAERYAPDEAKIRLLERPTAGLTKKLGDKQKAALKALSKELGARDFTESELYSRFFEIARGKGLEPKELFRAAYLVLLGRESGPKLAGFILAVGRERISVLLKQV